MLVKVCLFLLCVGVYACDAASFESTTEDELFDELEVFPENFVSRFPQESQFFRTKILVYLFFNIFSKHFAENEPIKFWIKFNKNDFSRVAIDAVFYEYLTKFADRKLKHLVFNPLEGSKSITEDIAIHRIGDYLDNLSEDEVPAGQSETRSQDTESVDGQHCSADCVMVPLRDSSFGIPGKDFPNYCDIPETSFTCVDKLIPGVYADIETGCQVFHTCWPDRIDSFLCPIGTTFNQELLTCDFWHESDCSSSPQLFDHLFAKDETPRNAEPSIAESDETLTTSDAEGEGLSELDIPEYDGTCQSLISKPLQLRMKFLPAKCTVQELKTSTPETTEESIEYDEIGISRLTRFTDVLSRVLRDALVITVDAGEHGESDIERIQKVAKRSPLKEQQIRKFDSGVVEAADEFAKPEEIDRTSEGMHHSTTELPSENISSRPNSKFLEKLAFEAISQEKEKPARLAPLKPGKLSEDSKKHVLDVMMKTLKLGADALSDDVLPFVEKMVLDSHRKMTKSAKSSSAVDDK